MWYEHPDERTTSVGGARRPVELTRGSRVCVNLGLSPWRLGDGDGRSVVGFDGRSWLPNK